MQVSKPAAQPSVGVMEKAEGPEGPKESRVIAPGDRSVTWTRNGYCQKLSLFRQIKSTKKHERTLSVIDNPVNVTVVGMLPPLSKTHSSSSILEPTATKSRSHSCHSTT